MSDNDRTVPAGPFGMTPRQAADLLHDAHVELLTLRRDLSDVRRVLDDAMVAVPSERERGDTSEICYRVGLLRARCLSLEVDREQLRAALKEALDGWSRWDNGELLGASMDDGETARRIAELRKLVEP